MNFIYYRFEQLPYSKAKEYGARKPSESRRDCTRIYDPEQVNPLSAFITQQPGIIRLSLLNTDGHINATTKRKACFCLKGTSGNLSSLFSEDPASGKFYGNPEKTTEGYLFQCSKDFKIIELFVILGGRYHVNKYYEAFLFGEYAQVIERCREASIPFPEYMKELGQ